MMNLNKALALSLFLLLSGCASTTNTAQNTPTAPMRIHMLSTPKIEDAEAHSFSRYVYRAAQATAEQGFKRFVLVSAPRSNRSESVGVYMFNTEEELESIVELINSKNHVDLLGIFDTDDYKDKRFINVNSVPGLA